METTLLILAAAAVSAGIGFVAGWRSRGKLKNIYAFDFHKDMVRVTISGRDLDIKCGECR